MGTLYRDELITKSLKVGDRNQNFEVGYVNEDEHGEIIGFGVRMIMEFLFGTTAPEDTAGKSGDVYLNTANGDFYKKTDAWTKIGVLMGPQGEQGPPGADGEQGPQGDPGVDGKSAYEIAVDNGFTGTEAEWLASLKGEQGPPGADGFGTEAQYNDIIARLGALESEYNDIIARLEALESAGA